MRKSELMKLPAGTKLWVGYNGPVPCKLAFEDGHMWLDDYGPSNKQPFPLCVGREGDVNYCDVFATFDDYRRARFASAFKRGWR